MTTLVVEMWPIEKVKPYPGNPRTIGSDAVKAVAASLEQYGWRQPIVVDADGVIVMGHTRLQAAILLGMAEVPVHVADLDAEEIKSLRIADNRTGEFAKWDKSLLGDELRMLLDSFNRDKEKLVSATQLGKDYITALLAGQPGEDEEATPELPANPITKSGDLWLLGRHRLLCGDSTDPDCSRIVLDGHTPNLMVTDPPYGVEYDAAWRDKALGYCEGRARGKVTNDETASWQDVYKLFPGNVAYVWMGALALAVTYGELEQLGYNLRALIVWNKSSVAPSRGHYHWKHENLIYAVRKGKSAGWQGDRKQATVWDIDKPVKSETGHSTQKPVECMERPIRNHKGDCYDPFCGSGTTIIAAERQGRTCCAIEIDPAYCVAVQRWENYTGGKATRG